MEDRKHNANVEKHFKDKLKTDRARIQVGKISGFGLLEMSRQRLRPGMLEATTQPCPHCHGTGLLRSDDNVALAILRQLEEEGTRKKTKEVCVTVPVAICNYLMNHKREHIALIEARYGMAVRLEADPSLVSPDYKIEKLKHQTIRVVEQTAAITQASVIEDPDDDLPIEVDEDEAPEAEAVAEAPEESRERDAAGSDDKPKKKRRRRRRRRGGKENGENGDNGENGSDEAQQADAGDEGSDASDEGSDASDEEAPSEEKKPARRRSRSRSRKRDSGEGDEIAAPVSEEVEARITEDAPIAPVAEEPAVDATEPQTAEEPVRQPEPQAAEEPAREPETAEEPTPEVSAPVDEAVSETVTESAPVAPPSPQEEPETDPAPEEETAREPEMAEAQSESDTRPKRRGWWSLRK
jgi:ribonuclease E